MQFFYLGIIVYGIPENLTFVGIVGAWVSVMDKYFPPLLGVYPTLPSLSLFYFNHLYFYGYPPALALQIFLKNILSALINTLLFTLVIAIPYLYEAYPLQYDSWVVRYWLLKMEEPTLNV